jgi:hypothetical protein
MISQSQRIKAFASHSAKESAACVPLVLQLNPYSRRRAS